MFTVHCPFLSRDISDPSGALSFSGKAVLHASGVDFSSGSSYTINMEQLQLFEDLGKGTYGVVKRVLHKPTNVAMAMKVRTPDADSSCILKLGPSRKFVSSSIKPS